MEIAQHLNFYMHYFDRSSPRINIIEPPPKKDKQETPERYPFGPFPSEVPGYSLDPYLLGLWESSIRGNPRLRYLYSYQVLEYAAFYYVKEDILQAVKRAIVAPQARFNPDAAVERIIDAISEDRQHDDARMKAVVKQVVDPEILWKEIEPNRDYFCQPVHFDGGLNLEPLLRPNWSLDDFASAWHPKFMDHVRKLRNALVHGREQRMFNVVAPTQANDERIRPWLAPLSIIAMQTILYRTL